MVFSKKKKKKKRNNVIKPQHTRTVIDKDTTIHSCLFATHRFFFRST